ncbi:MAG: MFS transporter [Acidimicrobiales bacterium]
MPERRRLLVDITPLRTQPQFRRLWGGYLVSGLGSQLTVVAVPYQVYRLTHSSFDVGMVGLAQVLPVLFGALAGGSVADAVDRRYVLLCSQGLLCACSVGLFLNALSARPALWPLYALAAAIGGFSATDSSTRAAVFVKLVDREQLASANALWQMLYQIGSVVGPAIGGILIAHMGVGSAYLIDTCTFTVSFFAVFGLRALPPSGGGTRFGWSSIKEGLGFLRGRQALQGTFVIDLDAMILGMPRALFPALGLVRFRGGAQAVGLLYAAPGAGALVGAGLTGWVSSVRRQGRAVLIAVTVWGASIAVFGVTPWLWPALLLLALAGAADVVSAVFRGTIMQTEAPDELLGRVSSIHTAVVTGGPRLGDAEAGTVAALAGTQASVISGGLGCLVGVGLVWRLMPKFVQYVAPTRRTAQSP